MSILFTPLGVLIGLLRTEQKPVFEIETIRKKFLFEFSVISGCVVLGKLLSAPEPQSSHVPNGNKKGSRVLHLLRTYYVLDIAFVLVGIPPNKARDMDLGTAAYLGSLDHSKQEWGSRVSVAGTRKSQCKGVLWKGWWGPPQFQWSLLRKVSKDRKLGHLSTGSHLMWVEGASERDALSHRVEKALWQKVGTGGVTEGRCIWNRMSYHWNQTRAEGCDAGPQATVLSAVCTYACTEIACWTIWHICRDRRSSTQSWDKHCMQQWQLCRTQERVLQTQCGCSFGQEGCMSIIKERALH